MLSLIISHGHAKRKFHGDNQGKHKNKARDLDKGKDMEEEDIRPAPAQPPSEVIIILPLLVTILNFFNFASRCSFFS